MISSVVNLWKEKKNTYKDLLKDKFSLYINSISVDYMAASLECCIFLLVLYNFTKAKTVLDLGSGFSSYALRYFKKNEGLDSNIISIDSSKEWLEKTSNFCLENNIDNKNFETWQDFKNKDIKFDLIFLDIDYTKNRPNYFSFVFEKLCDNGSFVLCDDFHKNGISKPLKQYLSNNKKLKQYDIKDQTIDKFGRFSSLIEVLYE